MVSTTNVHKQAVIDLAESIMKKAEPEDARRIRDNLLRYKEMDDSLVKDNTDNLFSAIRLSETTNYMNIAKEAMKNA